MTVSPSHSSLGEALLAVQAEAKAIQADAINEGFKRGGKPSKYVPLETLMPAVLPLLNKHGLMWTTYPTTIDGQPALRYQLTHEHRKVSAPSPQPTSVSEWAASKVTVYQDSITDTMPLLGVQNMQQLGAAITYGRRQSLMAVLGLVAERDTDYELGDKTSRPSGDERKLTAPLRAKVQTELETVFGIAGADLALRSIGVDDLTELSVGDAKKLRVLIDQKKAQA